MENQKKNDFDGRSEMTYKEVSDIAHKAFPQAEVLTDNYGQWVVYTDIKEKE